MWQIKLPTWLWRSLIMVNVVNFFVGFIIADRPLMFLALCSGLFCCLALKLSEGE